MNEAFRVLALRASNVKRLEAVEIEPPAGLVIVGGKNGSGKSSLLDSIWYALGGKNAQRATPQPIRDGEDSAQVTIALGDDVDGERLLVERTWKGDESTLVVRGADGTRLSSPQAVLDALTGVGAFDPLQFVNLSAREQREVLLSLVMLPFDLAELSEERAAAYDQRTDRNRELKSVDARIAAMPVMPHEWPNGEVGDILTVSEAVEAHRTAAAKVLANQNIRAQFHRALVDEANAAERVALARAGLAVAEDQEAATAALLATRQELFDALEPDPDMDAFTTMVANAEAWAKAAQAREALADLEETRRELAAEVVQCEDFMADIDERKARGLAEAVMPYDGLGFADDDGTVGITYQGKPFSQASAAERLRVAAAIAMAGDPKIRVMCIHDGSLLDDDNLAMLAEMADEHQYQVWLEVVGVDGAATIVIEDGAVR